MKQVTLNIPDNKFKAFMQVLKKFDFKITSKKEIKLSDEEKEFVDGLKNAIDEVQLHEKGKVKLQSARNFLNEL